MELKLLPLLSISIHVDILRARARDKATFTGLVKREQTDEKNSRVSRKNTRLYVGKRGLYIELCTRVLRCNQLTSLLCSNCCLDGVHDRWIYNWSELRYASAWEKPTGQRRHVAQLIALSGRDLAQHTAHNLA